MTRVNTPFSNTYIKIGIQRKLAWSLHKDDTQICQVFYIFRDVYICSI